MYFLAEQTGTSVHMIEQHYGHVNTIKHADRLAAVLRAEACRPPYLTCICELSLVKVPRGKPAAL